MTPSELEEIAADVAQLAAQHVRSRLGTAHVVGTKSTLTDVVTETDLEVERMIRRELVNRSPGSSVIGEELSDAIGDTEIGWIIDPIDGTVNFLYDLPVVAVSVAATLGGRVVAGAVSDVLRAETFSSALDTGARRNAMPVTGSDSAQLASALIGTGFGYDPDDRAAQAAVLNDLLPAARDIRCFGSTALALCWVACGRLDGYYQSGSNVYDYAAGALIASEAGATVELPGENSIDLLVASSPTLFPKLRSVVATNAKS